MFTCEFCLKELKTIKNLKRHQKTTKYCLEIQEKHSDKCKFICNYCKKSYTTNSNLTTHRKKCPQKEKEKQNKIEKDLETINQKLDNITNKPTTTIINNSNINSNNKINNRIRNKVKHLEVINDKVFKYAAHNFSLQHIQQGIDGYVDYAMDYPFKNKIACVDYARRKIVFVDDEGNIIEDIEMNKLYKQLCASIRDKNNEMIKLYKQELVYRLGDEDSFQILIALTDYQVGISNGAIGVDSKIKNKIVKEICARSKI